MGVAATATPLSGLAARIDAVLPQTQCTRCGEPDCASYARAIAGGAEINRCPPGGAEGIRRLAALTGRPALPLDTARGTEGPRHLAWIDEATCIGCTLCIKACPVDCIVGAPKRMHTVVEAWCTGCELCLPACPVDCIHLEVATPGRSGWEAWDATQADAARDRYRVRGARLADAARRTVAIPVAEPALAASPTSPATPSTPATPASPPSTTAAAGPMTTTPAPATPAGPLAGLPDAATKAAAVAAALARARARRGA